MKSDTTEVTIPSFEGEMGILKDHIPLITFLRPGIIEIKDQIERKYNQLLSEYDTLKKKLEEMEKENSKNQKIHDQFNQDIDELGRETESLVEEIDKWQT